MQKYSSISQKRTGYYSASIDLKLGSFSDGCVCLHSAAARMTRRRATSLQLQLVTDRIIVSAIASSILSSSHSIVPKPGAFPILTGAAALPPPMIALCYTATRSKQVATIDPGSTTLVHSKVPPTGPSAPASITAASTDETAAHFRRVKVTHYQIHGSKNVIHLAVIDSQTLCDIRIIRSETRLVHLLFTIWQAFTFGWRR